MCYFESIERISHRNERCSILSWNQYAPHRSMDSDDIGTAHTARLITVIALATHTNLHHIPSRLPNISHSLDPTTQSPKNAWTHQGARRNPRAIRLLPRHDNRQSRIHIREYWLHRDERRFKGCTWWCTSSNSEYTLRHKSYFYSSLPTHIYLMLNCEMIESSIGEH